MKTIKVMNIIQVEHGFLLTLHPEANLKSDTETQYKDVAHNHESLFHLIQEFFKTQEAPKKENEDES